MAHQYTVFQRNDPIKPLLVGTIRQCFEFQKHIHQALSRIIQSYVYLFVTTFNSQFDVIINKFGQPNI
jgi:hypothetical protein